MNEVEFEAQIVQVRIKKSVSQDKEGLLQIEFLPTDDLVDNLNRLFNVDETVKVTINKNEIPG